MAFANTSLLLSVHSWDFAVAEDHGLSMWYYYLLTICLNQLEQKEVNRKKKQILYDFWNFMETSECFQE